MALLLHREGGLALTRRLELDLLAPAAVGAFVDVSAARDDDDGRRVELRASAACEGREVARARATFVRVGSS